MTAPQTHEFAPTPSDALEAAVPSAEVRSWAPPSWPSDNFASASPLPKRAIGWRGQLRGR